MKQKSKNRWRKEEFKKDIFNGMNHASWYLYGICIGDWMVFEKSGFIFYIKVLPLVKEPYFALDHY